MSIREKSADVCRKTDTGCQWFPLYFSQDSCFLNVTQFRRFIMPRLKGETEPAKESFFSAIEELAQVLPAETIKAIAKDTGFIKRIRKIDPALFFWNLIILISR